MDDAIDGAAEQNEQDRITDAIRVIVEHRAVIEQAKGMLMLVRGIDADEAFQLLRALRASGVRRRDRPLCANDSPVTVTKRSSGLLSCD